MNSKSQPCVVDESYRFSKCLRHHLESKAGCRLPWHEQLHKKRGNLKTCTTLDEFKTITMENGYGIGGCQTKEIKDIVKETGCLTPCSYREIKERKPPAVDRQNESDTFMLWGAKLVSTDIRKEREKLSISPATLVGSWKYWGNPRIVSWLLFHNDLGMA